MTQAYNLSQLANNLNSNGQLDATDGLVNAVPIANGGTGASTASAARTGLGLGTMATQNSGAVAITGGSISGITDLAVADGGTGASTLSGVVYGNGASAFTAATAAQIVTAIGSTAVTNATNASNSTTQTNGDNTTKIATTEYVENMSLGFGQTWQTCTIGGTGALGRSNNTTYTNSTGKPIMIAVAGISTSYFNLVINGVTVFSANNENDRKYYTAIVPAGATYLVNGGSGPSSWVELRD